jgi:NAD(P)-dependent dehydrogenase (short-subunit alcohol dehydrogenase family)
MILKTLSIEWKRSLPNVAVAALHPGTTDTPLSRPFQQNVAADQLFSASQSVNYMMQVVERLSANETGKFWSFDGETLPW